MTSDEKNDLNTTKIYEKTKFCRISVKFNEGQSADSLFLSMLFLYFLALSRTVLSCNRVYHIVLGQFRPRTKCIILSLDSCVLGQFWPKMVLLRLQICLVNAPFGTKYSSLLSRYV